MFSTKLLITLAAILGGLGASFGAGWYYGNLKCEVAIQRAENQANQAALEKTKAINEIADELEKEKARTAKTKIVIRERVINAKDSSFGCRVNPDGMQLLQDAWVASHPSEPNQ